MPQTHATIGCESWHQQLRSQKALSLELRSALSYNMLLERTERREEGLALGRRYRCHHAPVSAALNSAKLLQRPRTSPESHGPTAALDLSRSQDRLLSSRNWNRKDD